MGFMEVAQPGPTQEERSLATLAHVLQIVGWWIAPVIIFAIKRESRFVSFHALQALLLQIGYILLFIVLAVFFFLAMLVGIAHHPPQPHGPPPAFVFVFPLVWVGVMGLWVVMIVLAIVYGIKAGRGEWAEYPLVGSLARKLLGLGPGGSPLQRSQ
jgi:uncharacterized Tic20 family protein